MYCMYLCIGMECVLVPGIWRSEDNLVDRQPVVLVLSTLYAFWGQTRVSDSAAMVLPTEPSHHHVFFKIS